MEVLKCYIDLTEDIRGDFTDLFITTTKPYRKASKDKLSRWVNRMLKGTGLDCTRSASTSMAKSVHLLINLILKAGGWRGIKSYAKHHDKPVEENKFEEAILQSGNAKTLKL